MPGLGTTAPAYDRVIQDVARHGNLRVQRGSLAGSRIAPQTLRLPSQSARLAWLAQNIPDLPGTAIVYVLSPSLQRNHVNRERPAPGSEEAAGNAVRTQCLAPSARPARPGLYSEEVVAATDLRLTLPPMPRPPDAIRSMFTTGTWRFETAGARESVSAVCSWRSCAASAGRRGPGLASWQRPSTSYSTQVKTWLKRADSERLASKLSRPVRYRWTSNVTEPLLEE